MDGYVVEKLHAGARAPCVNAVRPIIKDSSNQEAELDYENVAMLGRTSLGSLPR